MSELENITKELTIVLKKTCKTRPSSTFLTSKH